MDDLPLSKLPDGDPRNHLSEAALRRVLRATLNAELIQWEAEADVEARKLSDDKARIVISKSNLKAARSALRVLWEEYSNVNLAIREFWAAMSLEIEGISNSYELTGIQRRLLQIEFHAPPESSISSPPAIQVDNAAEQTPRELYRVYVATFPLERIKIRDICWAASKHYREWKRWMAGQLKHGSTPDLAFRRVLSSGKKPSQLKKRPRPPKWE
jgi:hypothetical protein